MEPRWRRWIGPGVIALVAVASIASVTASAAQRPWTPRACRDEAGDRAAAATTAVPATIGDVAGEAWFRLDPRLDRTGALVGQRLFVGLDGERGSRVLELPAESFASGPFGRIVLVGSDDGTTSHLRAVDVAGQCAWDIGTASDVIRRATLDPTGATAFEMRVDRGSRADLGIWSRPLDGSVPATRFLEPIGADDAFGPTFSTEFSWALGGPRLAIQSCGEIACRTRVVEPDGRAIGSVADPGLGSLVGLAGDTLVTYAACPGRPCRIVATNLATGARADLAGDAAIAVLVATPDGVALVHEVFAGTEIALRSVAIDGSSATDLGPVPGGLRLHATPDAAGASTRLGTGWVLLSPDGRLPDAGPRALTQIRRVTDGMTVELDEVVQ